MERADATTLLQRIEQRLEATGLTERSASIQAFGNPGGIRNVRHGQSKSPTVDFFAKLAPVLDVAPAWLAFGGNDAESTHDAGSTRSAAPISGPRLIGEVAAGLWRDVGDGTDLPSYDAIELPLMVGQPPEAQFGLLVRGPSINRVAQDGDILTCVRARAIKYRPTAGDLVIAERRRESGALVETTAKRLHKSEDGQLELRPDSDDPRHQTAIPLGTDDGDETVTVEIIALVNFAIRRPHIRAERSV